MRERYEAAVYYHFAADGDLLYVGCTTNPFARFGYHRSVSSWGRSVARIEIKWFDSHAEALEFEQAEIQKLNPPHNRLHTTRKRSVPLNDGHKFVADWERRFGVSSVDLGLACGCSLSWSRRFSSEVTHPIYRVYKRITIASGGYIPLSAFHRNSSFRFVSDEEARRERERASTPRWREEEAAYAFAEKHGFQRSEVTQ